MMRVVLFLLLVRASGLASEAIRLEASRDAMGGTFTVVVYGENRPQMEGAVAGALEEAHRLDLLLSNYRPSSEWSRINREAARAPVVATPELFHILELCREYSVRSEGAFDITVGPLMKIWGFYKGSGKLPHRAEVRSALSVVGYRNLLLDSADRTVRFARPGMEIDPGGIGKGYAVDRMVDILKTNGIRAGFITAAGSSIYGLGAPPNDSRGWLVQIRDPRNSARTATDVYLRDASLSTSGAEEKFFMAEGKMFSHIMDPRTGYPAQGMLQVSILAPRAIDGEAWTKPVFINGRQWAAANKPKNLRAWICGDKWDNSCAWLQ